MGEAASGGISPGTVGGIVGGILGVTALGVVAGVTAYCLRGSKNIEEAREIQKPAPPQTPTPPKTLVYVEDKNVGPFNKGAPGVKYFTGVHPDKNDRSTINNLMGTTQTNTEYNVRDFQRQIPMGQFNNAFVPDDER
jgi:RNA-splicing ligase RtcB